MGRKLFLRHLAEVAASPPANITNIHSLEEGSTSFTFSYIRNQVQQQAHVQLLAIDLDDYPDGSVYMLFSEDEDIDSSLPPLFEKVAESLLGKNLRECLTEVSRVLTDVLSAGSPQNPITLDDDESEPSEIDDYEEEVEDSDEEFGFSETKSTAYTKAPQATQNTNSFLRTNSVDMKRVRKDLSATKQAGFRVGVLGDVAYGCIVCVSIRVGKLGISEEAMEAWGLQRKQYLVLMIRFQHGYRDITYFKESIPGDNRVEMRVALCHSYKPKSQSAFAAFNQLKDDDLKPTTSIDLQPLFIGRPLNALLNERFAQILKFRESCAFNWPSAEGFVHKIQGKGVTANDQMNLDEYYVKDVTKDTLPSIVTADCVDGKLVKDVSLPLVAMQFLLRHFVRCTEFCLVCHTKVTDTFEALKPYVCSNRLCLWQYMNYGFGPSIEWELLSQPYVVDLLVSFCYTAARNGRLKEFPAGIDLNVPFLPHYMDYIPPIGRVQQHTAKNPKKTDEPTLVQPIKVKVNFERSELILHNGQSTTFRKGDWIVVRPDKSLSDYHFLVKEAEATHLQLSSPVTVKRPGIIHPTTPVGPFENTPDTSGTSTPVPPSALPKGLVEADCFPYNYSFDRLSERQQHWAVVTLLDTLPGVLEMQKFLKDAQHGQEPNLKGWRDGISKSALNLLRWIIASNRSCIMQVDRLSQDATSQTPSTTSDARVGGMENYMQFRFAQGAPDKEQRFVDCVREESSAAQQQHPTLFAWHGSPMYNWHSIIRQGLHYEEIHNGRACGNGVYFSSHMATSLGYAGGHYGANTWGLTWPGSVLKISVAFSLNEVVNAPHKFVHSTNCLVVDKVDWIQTRYLFVKSALSHVKDEPNVVEYSQDPTRQALNDHNKPVRIPITAVSKSRRPVNAESAIRKGGKRSRSSVQIDQATAEREEDIADSELSDEADQEILDAEFEITFDSMSLDGREPYVVDKKQSSYSQQVDSFKSKGKKRALDLPQTDFVPGSIDISNIKFLPPPSDATPAATKALMQAFKQARKTQESTSPHELGWYIDPEYTTNMYQWIVELHSFNPKLPLAQDLKSAGLTSIILEMRFTQEFPFAPPFIRVVSPRFLPFQQGGGGHVTDGGAICMELLTNSGWSAVNTIESVLLQVQLAISDEEKPARLAAVYRSSRGGKGAPQSFSYKGTSDFYGIGEAVAAYERACRNHGWTVPKGFEKLASQQ